MSRRHRASASAPVHSGPAPRPAIPARRSTTAGRCAPRGAPAAPAAAAAAHEHANTASASRQRPSLRRSMAAASSAGALVPRRNAAALFGALRRSAPGSPAAPCRRCSFTDGWEAGRDLRVCQNHHKSGHNHHKWFLAEKNIEKKKFSWKKKPAKGCKLKRNNTRPGGTVTS